MEKQHLESARVEPGTSCPASNTRPRLLEYQGLVERVRRGDHRMVCPPRDDIVRNGGPRFTSRPAGRPPTPWPPSTGSSTWVRSGPWKTTSCSSTRESRSGQLTFARSTTTTSPASPTSSGSSSKRSSRGRRGTSRRSLKCPVR